MSSTNPQPNEKDGGSGGWSIASEEKGSVDSILYPKIYRYGSCVFRGRTCLGYHYSRPLEDHYRRGERGALARRNARLPSD